MLPFVNTCNFPNKLIYNRLFKNILIKSNLYIPTMVAQTVKNLPAMKETWVWSLGWEDPLEKGMTIHSSIIAWRILWTEDPSGLQFMGLQRVRLDWVTKAITFPPTETQITLKYADSKFDRYNLIEIRIQNFGRGKCKNSM